MEQAIRKAIEGGWNFRGINKDNFVNVEKGSLEDDVIIYSKFNKYLVFSAMIREDPLFWQALGKSLGWTMWKSPAINASVIEEDYWEGKAEWIYHWHRFIDHLAKGEDVDTFFTNLLTEQGS